MIDKSGRVLSPEEALAIFKNHLIANGVTSISDLPVSQQEFIDGLAMMMRDNHDGTRTLQFSGGAGATGRQPATRH